MSLAVSLFWWYGSATVKIIAVVSSAKYLPTPSQINTNVTTRSMHSSYLFLPALSTPTYPPTPFSSTCPLQLTLTRGQMYESWWMSVGAWASVFPLQHPYPPALNYLPSPHHLLSPHLFALSNLLDILLTYRFLPLTHLFSLPHSSSPPPASSFLIYLQYFLTYFLPHPTHSSWLVAPNLLHAADN